MGSILQSHVYIEGRDADAVRVLVMSLGRARCSPARPNYSFMVIELSREGGGMHPNHSVCSQAWGSGLSRSHLGVLNLLFVFKIKFLISRLRV